MVNFAFSTTTLLSHTLVVLVVYSVYHTHTEAWWFTSEFNVTDRVTQGLGHDYRGRTLIAHGSSFGRMILLPAPVTSAGHEPRLAGFKSVAFTA